MTLLLHAKCYIYFFASTSVSAWLGSNPVNLVEPVQPVQTCSTWSNLVNLFTWSNLVNRTHLLAELLSNGGRLLHKALAVSCRHAAAPA
jgi:hypothetical protein